MADPEVLDAEMQQVAEAFGVAMEQVRRDHLISHVLGAISQDLPDRVIVFGKPRCPGRTYRTAGSARTSTSSPSASAGRSP